MHTIVHPRGALLVALGLLVAVLPGDARAAESTWNLKLEASGTYAAHFEGTGNGTTSVDHEDLQWALETHASGIVVRDGRIVEVGSAVTHSAATGRFSRVNTSEQGTVRSVCAGTGDGATGDPTIETFPDLAPPDAAELIVLRPFDRMDLELPCTEGPWESTNLAPARDSGWDHGNGPWDVLFTVPHSAWAQGKVIQLVESFPVRSAVACEEGAVSCELRWTGTLTLTRVQHDDPPPDPLLAPLLVVPPPDRPSPAAQGPVQGPTGTAAPQAPSASRARLAPDGSAATVRVSCPSGCSGSVVATAARGAKASAATRRGTLAAKRFTAVAGRARTVRVRFGRDARRSIRRAGGVRLAIRLVPRGGGRAIERSTTVRRGPAARAAQDDEDEIEDAVPGPEYTSARIGIAGFDHEMTVAELRDLVLRVSCTEPATARIRFLGLERLADDADGWTVETTAGPEGADLRVAPPQRVLDALVGRGVEFIRLEAQCTEPNGQRGHTLKTSIRVTLAPPTATATCTSDMPRAYRRPDLLASRVRIRVTCDGPTTVLAAFDVQHEEHLGIPTKLWQRTAGSGSATFSAAGTRSVRVKLHRWARRYVRRSPESWTALILVGAEMTKPGFYAMNPGQRVRIVG